MWRFQCILVLLLVHVSMQQQRVAPGVPPQHYQPPPPHQYQDQMQFQQVPVQQQQQQQQYQQHVPVQQQVPIQHQQVPIQHQQPPPVQHQVPIQQQQQHAPHGHAPHGAPQQILNAANLANEKEHLAEHLNVPLDTSKMSEQELQFHYFKMHDADNNNKLDGCELIKSLIHWHEQGHNDPANPAGAPQEKIFGDEELVGLIDPIFGVDDLNQDGYIDYPEFVQAQQKGAAKPTP